MVRVLAAPDKFRGTATAAEVASAIADAARAAGHVGIESPLADGGEGTLAALGAIDLKPRLPEILSSSDAARAIVLDLEAGESLSEHEVHERAWLVVLGRRNRGRGLAPCRCRR